MTWPATVSCKSLRDTSQSEVWCAPSGRSRFGTGEVLLCEEGDTNHQACHISDRCCTGAVVRLLCAASDVARPGPEPDKQGAISNLFFAGEQAGQVEQFTIHSSPSSHTPSHVSGLSLSGDEKNEVLFLGAN